MDRENYYILLELESEPPVTDPAQIKEALQRKKQEWTRWQDNPGRRNAALHNLGLAEDIEAVMLDPASRTREAQEAQKIKKEMLRRFEAELRILEGKGYILPREAVAIAVKYRAYGVTGDTVRDRAKCPITDSPPQKAAEEVGEIIDRMTARAIRRNLALLDCPDLYAFLGEQPYSSIKKLVEAAEAKRREAASAGSRSSQATIAQELAGICLQMFESFDSKQKYDRYLKISKYPALGELIDEEYTRARFISSSVLLRLINFAVEQYSAGVLDAEEYIRRYCTAYGIPVGSGGEETTCPACAAKNKQENAVCTSCAAPLRGECPGCGAPFEGGIAVCGECGFALADMVKALRHIGDAQNALIDNNWSSAQRGVEYAKRYWPGNPQIEPLEKRARNLEERYAQYVDNIGDCVRHNQYYAALELVNEAEARRIRLPGGTVEHVRRVVEDFERKIAELTARGAQPPFGQLLELASAVADSIELGRLMAKHPPQASTSLRAVLGTKQVRLQWSRSASPGVIEYVLVRKAGGEPLTAFDGDVLYDGAANSFVDFTAKPLCEYYYRVYARRGGAYSDNAAAAAPALIVPEIENLRILPSDMGAQLSWAFNPDVREVIIWRKLGGERPSGPGEGIRLENDRLDGFSDSKIKNDVEYWYYLAAVYVVDGRRIQSRGVCESVIPHKILAPVEQLDVARTDVEDEYVVNWNNTQYSDVLLMVSQKKPDYKVGEMVPVQDLLIQYRKLDLDARRADSARFRYQLSGGVYIFAAALVGKFATLGQYYYLTNVKDVENPTYDIVGDELFINMKWPAGLIEVAAAYRFDRFPASLEEAGTTVLYTTREQYGYNAGIVLKEPEQSVYYVKIYSIFTAPDGARTVSKGVELIVNNTTQQEVFYRFKYAKKLFSSSGTVSITISSPEKFVLPKAVFVGKIGRLPLKKTDGMPLFEVEKEIRVNGEITYQYRTNMLPKNLYIRMFFYEDGMYEKYRLLPAASVKVT